MFKLTIKLPKGRWLCSSVSIVNFEHVIVGWEQSYFLTKASIVSVHLPSTDSLGNINNRIVGL